MTNEITFKNDFVGKIDTDLNRQIEAIKNYKVTEVNFTEAKHLRANLNKALKEVDKLRIKAKRNIDTQYEKQMQHIISEVNNFDTQIKDFQKELIEEKLAEIDKLLEGEGVTRNDYPSSWSNLTVDKEQIIEDLPNFISSFQLKKEQEKIESDTNLQIEKVYTICGTKEQHIKLNLFLKKEGIKVN